MSEYETVLAEQKRVLEEDVRKAVERGADPFWITTLKEGLRMVNATESLTKPGTNNKFGVKS